MTSPTAGPCRKPWPEKPVAYRKRDTSTESRRLSDHYLIKATATLPALRSLTRCLPAPHDPAAVYCPPQRRH